VDSNRHARRVVGALLAFLAGGVVVSLMSAGPLAEGQGVLENLRRGVRAQNAFRRGKALYEERDYEAARERFTEALSLEPQHDEAQALLGLVGVFPRRVSSKPITTERYENALRNHILPAFGDTPLGELARANLKRQLAAWLAAQDVPEWYAFVLALARTGLPIGEGLALQRSDVDLNRRML
jgi:hypothetical protein